jgi:membrane-bound metal-dependent hydrolase YbcI (DUF457 family)
MDVLAHTLWTNALFHLKYQQERKQRYIAAAFGVVPDLIGFVPVTIYVLWNRLVFDPSTYQAYNHWTFTYAKEAYNYTHSLVIAVAAILLVMAFRKGKLYWPMLGWVLHIVIDFFTHPDFYQTPIFFPISNYQNTHGISWAHPVFMVVNYSLMVITYIIIFKYRDKRKIDAR